MTERLRLVEWRATLPKVPMGRYSGRTENGRGSLMMMALVVCLSGLAADGTCTANAMEKKLAGAATEALAYVDSFHFC